MSELIGQRISDRYHIEEKIGGGGMAHVYKAQDIILERPVAVKVLQPQYNSDEEFIRRFHREAQAATSLAHPNIVNIYDVGEEENLYYIVMEYIEGETLKEKIQHQGPLPLEQSVELMGKILEAMGHAHANGIIHRDIKPHNILLNHFGEAKVTDFGIARASSAQTITHTNSVMGSVHYLSPEQAKGGHITAQSDIYSLGIVLYEMVTGALPYTGDSAVSVALKHLQEPLPKPSEKRPGLPQSVENVILKATVKDPHDRYENVFAMQEDLKTVLSQERRNEAPFVIEEDKEQTKAVPIIKDEQSVSEETKIAEQETTVNRDVTKDIPPPVSPKKKSKKRWIWILLFLLLFFTAAAATAFTVLPSLFTVDETEVPDVGNMVEEEAVAQIESAELEPEIETIADNDIEENHVVNQDPGGGTTVKMDSTVTLYVSEGPERVEMPDVTGLNRKEAEERLNDFEQVEFASQETSEHPPDTIIGQSPEAGDEVVQEDTTVQLTYSTRPEFTLDNLEGESKDAVERYLENHRLNGSFETSYSEEIRSGRVIEHTPGPYTNVKEGDEVAFVISEGPEQTEEETAVEQIEAVIPVEVEQTEDSEEAPAFDIRIVYEDNTTEQEEVFVEETISETKTYRVPLEVTPETDGRYVLFVDDEEVQSNTFSYGDE
ncbi:serine/threonine protein kinase [Alteribacillus persepolensis]|uniref:Serine/threonine-protein kinase PrkC n=1 Tax=Alteribacillus persepolensis TaxID=568899 RepID=A0A1G7YJ21_9BACI|nr:Stk1 family PASTA domain-containing Ser/Thr kinase [Alteribacillus persepolensis]SDG96407.1 serine/threonine protein kinase [Alteribacillus persepolensis]